ncbi:MAG: [protein-PII] uridylyltransferase [Acidobacteriia bacterium]|nr:[protein-PII] uridylyltransferase [Terriglobia bacterium]
MEKLHSNPAWAELQRAFFATGDASAVQAALSALVDQIAIQAYRSSLADAAAGSLAMLAVGGFGRRELFPYSDVDILILVERESQTAAIKNALSEFVRLVWDSGLRLSHSVHTIAECAEIHEQNIELSISLLDRRLLDGSSDLYAKLETRLPAFFERQARLLARNLCQLTRTRHAKYQGTFYHLEPDVKETPGGLRDAHLVGWLAKLKNPAAPPNDALAAPVRFLGSLRCFLHYQAGRDQNQLTFDAQHELTKQGFLDFHESAAFMREYFRNARAIANESRRALDLIESSESSLVAQFRDWRTRLSNADFTVSNERILLRAPGQLESDPELFLRLFEFVARHGVPLAAETERRLEAQRDAFARYCAAGNPKWPALRRILSLPHAALALRAMHNTGLVQALFPEWNTITCLVIPDYYHRYTVDEHTLVAIEKLSELAAAKDPARRRLAEILSEIEDPALLRFALLFHDSGKGSNQDHSRRSVELARVAMQRIRMPAEDQAAVEFLIEHHLDLSAVMNSRDLFDQATARALAQGIGTLERLKLLAVLTYADISAVNPAAMTPWRLEQLWQAYRVTHQELVRELETDRIQDVPTHVADPAGFLKGLPVRYLRTHTAAEIEAHLELYEQSRPTGVAARVDRWSGVYRATIVARDMPALFASLAGAISSFGLDILKAEAFANTKGQILDTFVFADPKHTLDLNATELERLQTTLEQVALGKLDVGKLLDGRPIPARPKLRTVQPRVHFDSQACETATLVEIIAEDRPRLLYDLAATLSSAGCNIDVVLIDTEGHRAIDVFYVASDGAKLTTDLQSKLEKELLTAC